MIEASKKYRTEGGGGVRIYETDGCGDFPIHGAIQLEGGWMPATWTAAGNYYAGSSCCRDLVEVKPRIQRTVWLEVYEGTVYAMDYKLGYSRKSKVLALLEVKIDCEEGEGLDV